MNKWTRNLGLLAILMAPLAASNSALAQDDDEGRRVLTARDTETMDTQSAYARAAQQKRQESITFLRELLSRGDQSGTRKAEMMLRLAELYYDEGRYVFFAEMELFGQEQERCFNTDGCAFENMQPDLTRSQRWQNDSIRLYEQILENYPRYTRADEAMYFMASSLQDVGRREDGVEQFSRLVRVYPESNFVCDSYVNIGEFYFDNNNAYKALIAYKKATGYRDCDKYGFALYKLAWSYFNVGEYGEAITSMKEVVSYSQTQRESAGGAPLQLEEESLRDLVRFFADAGEIDEALAYFEGLGRRDLYQKMLKRLAAIYFEQGKWEDAVSVYRRLISESPNSADNPGYQNEIVQAYHKMGNADAELAEVDRMLSTYGSGSSWAQANLGSPDKVQDAQDKIGTNFLRIASFYHDKGRRLSGSQASEAFDIAYQGYDKFLENYPQSEDAYVAHYQYAELLYKVEKFDEAWDQYMAVVDTDAEGEHSEFCAESAIFAAEEMVKREGGLNAGASNATEVREPQPLTEWEQRLVDSCQKYATLYEGANNIQQILYKSAYLLYNKFHIEEAARQFRGVIGMSPGTRQAEQAANLILDSFVLTENYTALKENAKFFYDEEDLGSRTFKTEVYGIYQRASLKVIEDEFTTSQAHATAADAYLAFAEEFPDSEENARILNNASIYYREANQPGDVMRVRHILIDDPRFGDNTKYYYDQLGSLGFDYEDQANFDRAAFYYEVLFSLYPDRREDLVEADDVEAVATLDDGASNAIYRAALFRQALGQEQQSVANFQQFIATFPEHPDVNETRLSIAKTYAANENWSDAASSYYEFYNDAPETATREQITRARLAHARMLEAQNDQRRANRIYEETVAEYQTFVEGGGEPGAYTNYVAEMMYELALPKLEAFMALELSGCDCTNQSREDRALTGSLTAKGEGLVRTEAMFVEIVGTGSGKFGLASLVQMGRAYENMGDTLANGDIPFYLTPSQEDIYKLRIEDQVYPQRDKAAQAYSAALGKAFELTLYDANTALAVRRLGELDPEQYPALDEALLTPNATTSTDRNFTFETEL
ncbi:MAG: tetratricopeptide (TPR) repeat protein [Myxococcota bacterium]|jgi:tetratricopeptide (TPR) repeat protein